VRFALLIATWESYRFPVAFRLIRPKTHPAYRTENALFREEEYDVVLVSASTITSLKKAYPNYFVDSRDFLKNLSVVISSHNTIKLTR
jgi:hypothetical protein